METSDRSERLSSEINTDNSSKSGDSDITNDNFWVVMLESQNITKHN